MIYGDGWKYGDVEREEAEDFGILEDSTGDGELVQALFDSGVRMVSFPFTSFSGSYLKC